MPLRARIRRLVRLVCMMATAAIVAAPMLLGPATAPAMRLLAGEVKHLCMCGMEPGKCGCPECERLEAQRLDAQRAHPYAALRSSCDADDAPVPPATPLPPAVVPITARVPAPSYAHIPRELARALARSLDPRRPETPPPRSLAAV